MLYIVGNGAHASDIASHGRWGGRVTFLDDDPSRSEPWPDGGCFLVGVNDPTTRRRIAERLEATGQWRPMHEGRWVSRHTTLDPTVTFGRHTHINGGVFAVRCTIGDYTTIAPGVTICGDVTIGEEVFVGAGATISNLVTIGDRAVVGAGAVVLHDVPADTTVVGVPARPL